MLASKGLINIYHLLFHMLIGVALLSAVVRHKKPKRRLKREIWHISRVRGIRPVGFNVHSLLSYNQLVCVRNRIRDVRHRDTSDTVGDGTDDFPRIRAQYKKEPTR